MSHFKLAVCAEMVFLDLPFIKRVEILDRLGFGIGLWNWKNKDINQLKDTGAKFVIMNGYLSGNLTDKDEITHLLESIEESMVIAKQLNVDAMNIHGTGLDGDGHPVKPVEKVTGEMWLTAVETLKKVAKLGKQYNQIISLENLNTKKDHQGTPFASAHDTLALIKAVNSPYLKLNLDLYHAQVEDGNITELMDKCIDYTNEIQIADVPGRMEPGTGEVNWPFIAKVIQRYSFDRYVTLEAWSSEDSYQAVEKFKQAFTVNSGE